MKKLIGSLVILPLLTAGVVLGASSAQAANIGSFGPGSFANIYAIASPPGSSVTVKITGTFPCAVTSFSFRPPFYNVSLATDAFSQFGGESGIIRDLSIPTFGAGPFTVNLREFLNLDGVTDGSADTFFDLATVSAPRFAVVPGLGTFVNFNVTGNFRQGSNLYKGSGLFSATFVGLNPAQILALASSPSGITSSYSATMTTIGARTSIEVPRSPTSIGCGCAPKSVPEPSNIAGLVIFAGVSALLIKRGKKS